MNQNTLLDTDVLVSCLRGYPQTVNLLKSLLQNDAVFYISVVTVVEIESGIRAGEKNRTKELLDSMEVIPLDSAMAHLAGAFMREYR